MFQLQGQLDPGLKYQDEFPLPTNPPISRLFLLWLTQKGFLNKAGKGPQADLDTQLRLSTKEEKKSFLPVSLKGRKTKNRGGLDVLTFLGRAKWGTFSWNREKYPPKRKGNGGLGRQSQVNQYKPCDCFSGMRVHSFNQWSKGSLTENLGSTSSLGDHQVLLSYFIQRKMKCIGFR